MKYAVNDLNSRKKLLTGTRSSHREGIRSSFSEEWTPLISSNTPRVVDAKTESTESRSRKRGYTPRNSCNVVGHGSKGGCRSPFTDQSHPGPHHSGSKFRTEIVDERYLEARVLYWRDLWSKEKVCYSFKVIESLEG